MSKLPPFRDGLRVVRHFDSRSSKGMMRIDVRSPDGKMTAGVDLLWDGNEARTLRPALDVLNQRASSWAARPVTVERVLEFAA